MTNIIQIDDEVKKKLFQIKLKLEEERGSAITYNELINYLLENQKFNLIKRKNMKDFRKFEGIISKSAVEEYWFNKKKELEREENRAPLKK